MIDYILIYSQFFSQILNWNQYFMLAGLPATHWKVRTSFLVNYSESPGESNLLTTYNGSRLALGWKEGLQGVVFIEKKFIERENFSGK